MLLTLEIGKIGRVPARVNGVMLFIFLLLIFGAPPLRAGAAANSGDEEYERLFVLANTEFTLLHELAHVLIWELKPPIFGREEDAADTIAVMAQMMVPAGAHADARNEIEKLHAVADGWKLEWKLIQEDELETAYWDLHSLEIQRYYTIACLVYGADPGNRTGIKEAAQLPVERAEWCHEEYALAKSAMDWLLTHFAPGQEIAHKPKRGEVTVSYMGNTTLEGEKLDQWLRQSGLAERLARAVTGRFDLPRDVLISFESCPFPNAAWDVKTAKIQVCHSLLNRFLYLARELSKDRSGSADSTIWSAAIDHGPVP